MLHWESSEKCHRWTIKRDPFSLKKAFTELKTISKSRGQPYVKEKFKTQAPVEISQTHRCLQIPKITHVVKNGSFEESNFGRKLLLYRRWSLLLSLFIQVTNKKLRMSKTGKYVERELQYSHNWSIRFPQNLAKVLKGSCASGPRFRMEDF